MKHLVITLGLACLPSFVHADPISLSVDEIQTWNAIGSDGQISESASASKERIIGKPDFVKVIDLPAQDANMELTKKIGLFMNPKREVYCSGSLVGPNLFLTNHHCIAAENGGTTPAEDITIWMEYTSPSSKLNENSLAGVTKIVSHNQSLDYALLELNKPLGNKYGWLEVEKNPNSIQQSRSVKIIQHPAGRPKEIVTNNTDIINCQGKFSSEQAFMCYLADTEGGSSGSPVFDLEGSKIIALHHSGMEGRFNLGTKIVYIAEKIKSYLPVTGTASTSNNAPAKPASAPAPASTAPAAPAAPPKAAPPTQPATPPEDNNGGWKPII